MEEPGKIQQNDKNSRTERSPCRVYSERALLVTSIREVSATPRDLTDDPPID
jgi:hypothetical protein